jgi:two-component system KDP operon response regulator KdpE
MKALVFAADATEGDLLRQMIAYAGVEAEVHGEMQVVLADWSEHAADLIIITSDTTTALRECVCAVREVTQTPLLVIADPVVEVVHCDMLQVGADLVLMRPVGPRVLIAYVQVLLRRVDMVPQSFLNAFHLDNFSLDAATRSVTVKGMVARRLTPLEFRLLYVLVSNREQIVPSDTLIERVWGYVSRGDAELLRGLISRVRRKVEPDPQNPRYIENIPAVGYRFRLESSARVTPGQTLDGIDTHLADRETK